MFPRFPPRATFVTDTNVSPFSPSRNICYGHKCFPVFPRAQHLLRTQMFPRFPPRATFVADRNVSPFFPARNICCGHKFLCPGHKKMFLILFRNILCPQQMFPSLHSPRNIICYGHKCFPVFPRAQHLLRTQMFPRFPPRATFVTDTNVSPFSPARNICCGHKCFPVFPRAQHLLRTQIFVSGTQKNVSDFVQKHFVSATNVSQFAQPKKHHEQQCVRNNVSSFASTLCLQVCPELVNRCNIPEFWRHAIDSIT